MGSISIWSWGITLRGSQSGKHNREEQNEEQKNAHFHWTKKRKTHKAEEELLSTEGDKAYAPKKSRKKPRGYKQKDAIAFKARTASGTGEERDKNQDKTSTHETES